MTPETTITTEPAPGNFFSRLMGVYFSPGETFKEIGRNPTFLIALIILMLIGGISAYLLIERITVPRFFGASFEQAVAQGRMPQERADQQLAAMIKIAPYVKIGFFAWGFVQMALMSLIVAGLFKLISMVLGTENQFKPVYAVTVYAMVGVFLLSTLVFLTVLYLKPVDEIEIQNLGASNLGVLLSALFGSDGLPKFIMSLARWADLFMIWLIALLSIGYAAVSRKLKASTVAFALGGLYAGLAILVAIGTTIRG